MRISFLIIIFLLSATLQLLFAASTLGQDIAVEKVRVSLENEELTKAFKQIERQTALRFFYRKAEVRSLNKLSLNPARRTIEETLFELLHNTGFNFRQIDQSILIEKDSILQNIKIRISGTVMALDNRQPLSAATVELLRTSDLQVVGKAVTDASGQFNLTTTEKSPLSIRISLMGYHAYREAIKSGNEIILPEIYLEPDPKELKEVRVAVGSPLVKQEVDRLVYNVQADPDNKTSSVLDILAKVPLISVDVDGSIRLKGSSSFKVLIDGRTSSLLVNNPKEIFRVMPANSIASIEVITIPPAKYDSEGLTGIINVVTVRKKLDGYNGNLNLHYKDPNGPRNSAGLTLKSNKFAIAVFEGYNVYNTPKTPFSIFRENTAANRSTLYQNGTAQTKSHQGIVYTQFSYEIDSLKQIAGIFNYSGGKGHRIAETQTTQISDNYSSYLIGNDGKGRQQGYDLGVDYQMGFGRNKKQTASFSYRFNNNLNDQHNRLQISEQVNTNLSDYYQENQSGRREHTLQFDYMQPVKQIMVESGIKAIFRNNISDYRTSLSNSANSIDYEQNVYALYNSYQFKLQSWTVKAGARLEMTAIKADFSTSGRLHTPAYNRLFPSIAIQKKVSRTAGINFGYTERISRPGISQLNPYVDRQDPQSISFGNPNLRPELNHTITVNYSLYNKYSINSGLSCSFSNNSIQYVSVLGDDGITRNTFDNLGKNTVLSGYTSVNYSAGKHFSMNANAELKRISLTGTINGLDYKRDIIAGSSNVNFDYKFSNDWRSGFEFLYYSPNVTLQSSTSPYYYTSFNLGKSFLKKKMSIKASASNLFSRYLNYKIRYTDPRYTHLTQNDIVYRRFNIYLNYSFGKLRDGAVKKNKKSVRNDDTSTVTAPSIPAN